MLQMMDSRAASGWRVILSTRSGFWLAVAVVLFASIPMRLDGATPDVSWLTSMCERMLDGEKGWIDIFETTPPIPTLLYMPGVLLARLLGVSSEAPVFATAYFAALFSLAVADRILPKQIDDSTPSRWVVTFPAAVFLLLLSNDAFAQREWFAAAFSLPIFAVFARHAEDERWPPLSDRLVAATLAGLAFAIKPPLFALPFIAMAGREWIRTKSLSYLFPSMLPVAAVAGVAITAASLAIFPAYLDGVTTLMREVYVPLRINPLMGVLSPPFNGVFLCVAIALILMARRPRPAAILALVVATAYVAIFFIQGKFFGYHLMPAALFAMIALAAPLWERAAALGPGARAVPCATYSVAVCAVAVLLFNGFADGRPRMRDLSWADNLDRPTALAITTDISVGFPLAQHVGARWVDRIHGQWVAKYTRMALRRDNLTEAENERYRRYHERDIVRTRNVIRDRTPEIIFQCAAENCEWLTEELLKADPALLDAYEEIAEEGAIRVLRRREGV